GRRRSRHVDGCDQVVAVADEPRVLTDVDEDVEVARGAAALACVAAPCDPDPLAGGDPGGNVDGDLDVLDGPPAAVADVAGLLGYPPVAVADVAGGGADDLPERRAGDDAQLTGPTAALARLDRRARLGAVPTA